MITELRRLICSTQINLSMAVALLIGVCILSVIIGIIIGKTLPDNAITTKPNFSEMRTGNLYRYINPLLECDAEAISDLNNFGSIKRSVENLIGQHKDEGNASFVAVYYRDMNNGPWFGINENEQFAPASLLKVPLMMAYYKLSEKEPTIFDKKITIEQKYDYNREQNIIPTEKLQQGQTYTVKELMTRMITHSDNQAYYILANHMDDSINKQLYKDMGIDLVNDEGSDISGNVISVREYSSFFRVLFNASYLTNESSEEALDVLTKTEYNGGLKRYLPDTTIAHKFGERRYEATGEIQLHDCGIIYVPHRPYLLCIMTRGKDIESQAKVISDIAREVYVYKNSKSAE